MRDRHGVQHIAGVCIQDANIDRNDILVLGAAELEATDIDAALLAVGASVGFRDRALEQILGTTQGMLCRLAGGLAGGIHALLLVDAFIQPVSFNDPKLPRLDQCRHEHVGGGVLGDL